MKRVLPFILCCFAIINPAISQTFNRSFDTPNPLGEWSGNTESWSVVNNSTAADGSINSKTLKLNATGLPDQKYLSIQNPAPWGEEQSWTFWIGRNLQSFTAENRIHIWLWTDRSNLKDPLINGYRIRIGDNLSAGDDIVLERVVNGEQQTVASGNNYIPNGITDYGISIRVIRNKNSIWTIYATISPTTGGGVNANTSTVEENINNLVNPLNSIASDSTFKNFDNGYFGINAIYSGGINARQGFEFDNFQFNGGLNYKEYTWIGASGALYTAPANWSPQRNIKKVTDILKFNSTSHVTGVVDEAISGIEIGENSNIVFENPTPVNLILEGGSRQALQLETTGTLKVLSDQPLIMEFPKGAKAHVYGTLEFSKSSGNVEHNMLAREAGTVRVTGSLIQNCNGNIFGTSGARDIATFESGSSFVSNDGSNPFSLPVPDSKVVFKTGSNYVYRQNLPFGSSGRKYSNIEVNSTSITFVTPGALPLVCDNLTITNGNVIIKNTSSNFEIQINGNLSISNSGSLQLIPSGLGKAVLDLQGKNSVIAGADRLTIAQNSTLKISNNSALNNDLHINGTLNLFSGIIDLNSHTLSFDNNATIQRVKGSLSAAPVNNPNINYIYGDGGSEETIITGLELLPEVKSFTLNNSNGLQLTSPVAINQTLAFQNGIIFSDEINLITLKPNASVANAFDTRYIEGPIVKESSSTNEFEFPTGKNGKLRPLGIIPTSSALTIFKANYFNSAYNIDQLAPEVKEISKKEWWDIQRISGSANAKVKLFWNSESGINPESLPDLRVGIFDGVLWQNAGVEFSEGESFIISDELGEFGPVTFAGVNESVFPVDFYSFTAKVKPGVCRLQFSTASEHNNLGFEIQKSEDGIIFKNIAFINPVESNDGLKKYEYLDYNFNTSSFFRIKQVDFNGTFSFSKMIYIESIQANFLYISPNPAAGDVYVIGLADQEVAEIKVNTVDGLGLGEFAGNPLEVRNQLNTLFSSIPAGIYFILIKQKEKINSLKFFKR